MLLLLLLLLVGGGDARAQVADLCVVWVSCSCVGGRARARL